MGALIIVVAVLLILIMAAVLGSGRRGFGPAAVIGLFTLILLILLFYSYA